MATAEQLTELQRRMAEQEARLEALRESGDQKGYLEESRALTHSLEWPEKANLQVPLFERARQLGIIPIIERLTDRKIGPDGEYTEDEIIKYKLHRLQSLGGGLPYSPIRWPTAEQFTRKPWDVYVRAPRLAEDGNWDLTLRIDAQREVRELFLNSSPRGWRTIEVRRVGIAFTLDETLAISGKRHTILPSLPAAEEARKSLLEKSLQEVFDNPQVEKFDPYRHSLVIEPWRIKK